MNSGVMRRPKTRQEIQEEIMAVRKSRVNGVEKAFKLVVTFLLDPM